MSIESPILSQIDGDLNADPKKHVERNWLGVKAVDVLTVNDSTDDETAIENVTVQFAQDVSAYVDTFVDTDEITIPEIEEPTEIEIVREVAIEIIDTMRDKANEGTAELHKQEVAQLNAKIAALKKLVTPDTLRLIAENDSLQREVDVQRGENERLKKTIEQLRQDIFDRDRVIYDKQLEGPRRLVRLARMQGSVALHALRSGLRLT